MVFWMTRDAFYAGLRGVGVIVLFVGYNTLRSLRRRYTIVRRDEQSDTSKWN